MTHIEWNKPSPGTWEFDASHQTRPYGRFMDEAVLEPTEIGFAEGFADAGIPLRTIEPAIVNGWYYMCVRSLGGPAEPKGAPPKFVMKAMFALVPELRRRNKRATAYLADRGWENDINHWFDDLRTPFVEQLDALASTDPQTLDDGALARHVTKVRQALCELTRVHFEGVPSGSIPLGDYLVHSERWSVDARDAMRAVAGFTSVTTEPVAMLDRIVEALREDGALAVLDSATAQGALDAIHAHGGAAAEELSAYQLSYGQRATTDFSVFGETLNELPEVIVESLRQRVRQRGALPPAQEQAVAAERELRQRIPDADRQTWDALLAAARRGFERREDEGDLMLRAVGIARLALLEAGRRLVEEGRLEEMETTLDLTGEEVVALLAGAGPSREVAAAHTAQRRQFTALVPPARIGAEGAPPPIEAFPPAVARIVEAMFAFVSRFDPEGDPILADGLAGHGVSPGVVEGRATVVRHAGDFARFSAGDILVAPMTTPAFNVLLAAAAGVVTETGGLISHAAIVSREFGIPGIVGVAGAIESIPDGALVRVNGDEGTVTVLDAEPQLASAPLTAPSAQQSRATMPEVAGELVDLVDAADAASFGGKAASLSRLLQGGLVVPSGFALDVDFAQAVAAGDPESERRLRHELGELGGPFAVRSSATAEDSTDASFAGQFSTVLGAATADEVVAAVSDVWESGASPGVEAYRARLGLTAPVRMAVVVQQLVDATTAGVLFFDPSTDQQVVEAAWGIGETVVDGSLSPDRYRIDADGRELSVELGDKRVEVVMNGAGVVRNEVDPTRAHERCLTQSQLVALATMGRAACATFGDARDIEWAIAGNDVYCLQARPITRVVS